MSERERESVCLESVCVRESVCLSVCVEYVCVCVCVCVCEV